MEGAAFSAAAREAIDAGFAAGHGLHVSMITAWEVATLVRKGRYDMQGTPSSWFAELTKRSGMVTVDLTPQLLIDSVFLPGEPPNDPADRIIAATARLHGLTLVTRDKRLRVYAATGAVELLVC